MQVEEELRGEMQLLEKERMLLIQEAEDIRTANTPRLPSRLFQHSIESESENTRRASYHRNRLPKPKP